MAGIMISRKHQPKRMKQPNGKITRPTADEFYHHYIVENKSRKDLAEIYNVHKGSIDNWCKEFGFKKEKKQQIELAVKNTPSKTKRMGIYNHRFFEKYPEKKTESGCFYILKFSDKEETFYKYGITSNNVHTRWTGRVKKLYDIEVIEEQQMTLFEAFEKENLYKKRSSPYLPKKRFPGWTECFL